MTERKLFWLTFWLTVLVFLSPTLASQRSGALDPRFEIKSGQAGLIKIGMALADATDIWVKKYQGLVKKELRSGAVIAEFYNSKLSLETPLYSNGRGWIIAAIGIYDPRFTTEDGLAVGSPLEKLFQIEPGISNSGSVTKSDYRLVVTSKKHNALIAFAAPRLNREIQDGDLKLTSFYLYPTKPRTTR